MLRDGEEVVVHDGRTSLVRLSSNLRGTVTLTVLGYDDQEWGQVTLKAVADGYEITWHTATGEESLPFLTWSNEGPRVSERLADYQAVLTPRTYNIVTQPKMSNLLFHEFLRLLQKAVAYDADVRRESWKRRERERSLYHFGFRLGPKTIQELAHVFLSNEHSTRQGV